MRTAAWAWAHGGQQHLCIENSTYRQANIVLKGPDLALMRYALSLGQRYTQCLVSLTTGHVALNRHLKLVGVKDSPLYSEEEEMALHLLGQCPALVTIRQHILAMHSFTALELGKVRFLNLIRFKNSCGRFTTPYG